jgi:Predicted nucleic acid-binding protein, contains PIN domain
MILPDINLLVYTYNSDAPLHRKAKDWWEECLSESRLVGLPWAVLLGYLRLMTSRTVLQNPLSTDEAVRHMRSWLGEAAGPDSSTGLSPSGASG